MIHSPAVHARYAHIRRLIIFESIGIIGAGLLAGAMGVLGREPIVTDCGIAAVVLGVISWIIRGLRAGFRRRYTPTILLISEEGIGAILPNTSSLHLRWSDIRAREIRMQADSSAVPTREDDLIAGDQPRCSIQLKGYDRQRLYLTEDLDGYNELLEILNELEIKVRPSGSPRLRFGISHDRPNGLERRTWQTRN